MLERDQNYGLGKVLAGSQLLQDPESAKAATASLERRLVAAEAPDVEMLQDFLAEEGTAPAAGQTADHGEAGQPGQARLSPSCIVVAKDLPPGLGFARKEPTESRLLKTAMMAVVTVAAAMTGAKLDAQSMVPSSHLPVVQRKDPRAFDQEQRTVVGRGSDGRQALIDAVLKTIEGMELAKRDPVRNYEAKVNCLNKIATWTDGGRVETPISHVRHEAHDWTFTLDNEMIHAIGMTFNASPGEPGPMPARIKQVEEPIRVEQVVVDVTLDGRPDWYRKMEAERTKEGS